MSLVKFTAKQISSLLTICSSLKKDEYNAALKEEGLPDVYYASDIGRVMLVDDLTEINSDMVDMETLLTICRKKKDMRCQVGQVKSNVEKRLNANGQGPNHNGSNPLGKAFSAFLNNVNATVQLLDKTDWEIGTPDSNGKVVIKSVECRHLLDLSEFGAQDKPLCDSFFYANELVPDTDILGSGFFIAQDKVVTAAHVLKKAFLLNIAPENIMLIRGHFAFNSKYKSVEVNEGQIYLMDQTSLLQNEQIRYGSQDGDLAWIKVKPYGQNAFSMHWNGFAPQPVKQYTKVYALGHGLGLPMKLSFGGLVTDGSYNQLQTMFACDMNILPGSSGAPIFDADTHRLVGIVSGLHEIYTEFRPKNHCADIIINMIGEFSGVATHITPFRNL